jgi:copper chaperone|nr:heavy metal-associated domain-containing protein [Acidithiobacillus caldus]
MTCSHCVRAVREALEAVPGVHRAEVSLKPSQATVQGDVDPKALLAAVEAEGYHAEIQP